MGIMTAEGFSTTCKCVITVLASKILAAPPVILYPIKFTVELRIK
jgi:hypothetical protein